MDNLDGVDAVADLLIGDDDGTHNEAGAEIPHDQVEEEEELEGQAEEQEPGGEEIQDDGSDDDSSDESGGTWSSALGLEEADSTLLNIDEDGGFAGVNVQVNGKKEVLQLKDLVHGYQSNKSNTEKSQSLSAERTEFEGIRNNVIESYTTKLQEVGKVTEYLHTLLMGDYEATNWDALRAEDPANYAAAKQDYESRKSDINEIYNVISQTLKDEKASNEGKRNQVNSDRLNGEMSKVVENNPEWSDQKVLKNAFVEMSDFVSSYGISEQEFSMVQDARHIELIKDAMAYRKGKEVESKRVKHKIPGYQKKKSGRSKVSKVDQKLKQLSNLAASTKGSDRKDAQVDAIAQLFI